MGLLRASAQELAPVKPTDCRVEDLTGVGQTTCLR